MDVSHILDPLNEAQRQAVCAPAGHIRILAGAGSGKTRVLVYRIAWLIETQAVSPYGILAVTFTNKSAGEMRGRIEQLLGVPTGALWVGTFHGIAHRLLRAHWEKAGLSQGFQILDSEDQRRALRRVIRGMGLDESRWQPKELQWYINARKEEGQRPQHLEHHGNVQLRHMIEIYQSYETMCQRGGLVDFAELLLRAHELWLQHSDILQHYQNRFRHILVDEFQDTNTIQYAWLRLLAGNTGYMFIVGDDDQSIYGWRGARVENIQHFTKDFSQAKTFRLEQNYRSTGMILKAANGLIANNESRLGKELWTEDAGGDPIQLYSAFNELDEAHFVADQIRSWVNTGGQRNECAILYRSNAQSRVFEEILIQSGIPYRIYGGLRFFERQEIKDALAYLRLIQNRTDDTSFERIINVPTRGIGGQTVALVREDAKLNSRSLWQSVQNMIEYKEHSARAIAALQNFVALIERLSAGIQKLKLFEQVEHIIHHSGLVDHYQREKGEKGRTRLENLEELVNAARYYEIEDVDDDLQKMDGLSAFLSHAALEAGERQADEWEDCVQLMTLHSAKGLEFKQVFMSGMEEGLFPHRMSIQEPGRLEEERRLCYVGITRAMQKLYITYAEKRRLHGAETYACASRFIKEIPAECVQEVRLRSKVIPPVFSGEKQVNDAHDNAFPLGQRVIHQKFGEGVILNYEGQGQSSRVQVNFENAGSKWLVLSYADLKLR